MKKFITVFFLSLFLFFNISSISSIAESKSFTQGLYNFKDIGLTTGYAYKIRNSSPTGKAVVIIFDGNQMMQEFIRLEPNSPDYIVKPLDFDFLVIIIGGGSVTFS